MKLIRRLKETVHIPRAKIITILNRLNRMKILSAIILVCIVLGNGPYIAIGKESQLDETSLEAQYLLYRIKTLGLTDHKRDMQCIARCYEYPALAAKYLMEELHEISEDRTGGVVMGTNWNSFHVIWCIRALRAITGLDFRGQTSITGTNLDYIDQKGQGHRAYWLRYDANHKDVRFFGLWMSRDVLYIAPVDAQRQIIQKWRHWYQTDGNTYKYLKQRDYNDWYF